MSSYVSINFELNKTNVVDVVILPSLYFIFIQFIKLDNVAQMNRVYFFKFSATFFFLIFSVK